VSEPAQNFIRLRNGLKEIDEKTLKLHSTLREIAKNQDKILKIDSDIERKKISIAEALNSEVSDIELYGNISILVQNRQEQINSSIQSQKDSISENQKESKMLDEELSNHEAELDRLIHARRSESRNRFLKFTFATFSLVALAYWNMAQGFVDGALMRVGNFVIGMIYLSWFFGLCAIIIYSLFTSPPDSEEGKREHVKYIEGARIITSQIDDTRARIKGRKRSDKTRQKNIANYKKELKELENVVQKYDSIKVFKERLAGLREENALLASSVVELEKENAEIWTSISDLIPSEFH
jgi:chromosome segregation ATPase